MDVDEQLSRLAEDGPLLAAAARRAGLDAPVPGTDWTVRELVTHVGGIHRWAADIVATGGHDFDTPAGAAVGTGPDDGALLDWFGDGHAALVETLRAAPADLDCATFLPAPSPLAFWARRQAHETAVHRGDAERAAGASPEYPVGFAQDGIAEVLLGFAARRSNAVAAEGTLHLAAGDGPSWLVTFGGERIRAEVVDAGVVDAGVVDAGVTAGATVDGTSSELYSWLWNRPSAARVSGDESLARQWRQVRVRWA